MTHLHFQGTTHCINNTPFCELYHRKAPLHLTSKHFSIAFILNICKLEHGIIILRDISQAYMYLFTIKKNTLIFCL
jgi:hypothetical protein